MKCVCAEDCFLKHETSRPIHYLRGDVKEFEECPQHFIATAGAVVKEKTKSRMVKAAVDAGQVDNAGIFDFASATEEVLMAADYSLEDLKAFGTINYAAKFGDDDDKTKIVAKFVDARYRNYVTNQGLHASGVTLNKS